MEDSVARLQAEWAAINAQVEQDKLSVDEQRAALLTKYAEAPEPERLTHRDMAEALDLAHSRITYLLRYHKFLVSAETKITEHRFRAYWNELLDPYENSRDEARKEVYTANMFELIQARIAEGIPPGKPTRNAKKATQKDIRKYADPLRALRKEVDIRYKTSIAPMVKELKGLLNADRSTYAPSQIGGIAYRLEREMRELIRLMLPDTTQEEKE